jgi:hypothetical protein
VCADQTETNLTYKLCFIWLFYQFAIPSCSYSDELPSRFKKTLFKDVKKSDDTIDVDNLNRILVNIGRSDQILSSDELDMILKECGAKETSRSLSTAAVIALVWKAKRRNDDVLLLLLVLGKSKSERLRFISPRRNTRKHIYSIDQRSPW